MSIVAFEEFDCSNEKTRTLQLTGYAGRMGEGIPVKTQEGDGRWKYMTPDSISRGVYKVICK